MNRRQLRQRLAARLGLVGGALGAVAGLVQLSVGSRIPEVTGAKASPVALGSLTVVLSIVGMLSAVLLQRHPGIGPGRRIAAAVGLLVPGALCFSTVGTLWYVPGVLLVAAAVYATLAGDPAQTRKIFVGTWLHVLISVLGAFEVLMAVSAGPAATVAVGLIGGLALMTAPWPASRAIRLVLLLIGTVPFAVLIWWSVAGPLLAVVALGIGVATLRRRPRDVAVPTIEPSPVPNRQPVSS
jgi:hypothetical protein